MKISSKGRYGLRSMVYLAVYGDGTPIPLNQIAEKEAISPQYLEQVFSALKKAKLVMSIKGPGGGYKLGAPAEGIRVGDIIRVLEGEPRILEGMPNESVSGLEACIRVCVWEKVDEAVLAIIDHLTLADLAEEASKELANAAEMYYI